jgi:hypothetical protein
LAVVKLQFESRRQDRRDGTTYYSFVALKRDPRPL